MNRKRIAAVGGIAAAVCLVVGAGIFFLDEKRKVIR